MKDIEMAQPSLPKLDDPFKNYDVLTPSSRSLQRFFLRMMALAIGDD